MTGPFAAIALAARLILWSVHCEPVVHMPGELPRPAPLYATHALCPGKEPTMAEPLGSSRPCRRCGKTLVFLEGQSGPERPMPAQPIKAVYVRDGDRVYRQKVVRLELEDGRVVENAEGLALFVNHYETCSDPGHFSRRGGEARRRGRR